MVVLTTVALTGSADAASIAKLDGTWVLVQAGGRKVAPDATARAPYFTISGKAISGFDGCNQFSGDLEKPGHIRSTRRGCKAGYLELPLDLNDPASHLSNGTAEGSDLRLPAQGGHPASQFKRK